MVLKLGSSHKPPSKIGIRDLNMPVPIIIDRMSYPEKERDYDHQNEETFFQRRGLFDSII